MRFKKDNVISHDGIMWRCVLADLECACFARLTDEIHHFRTHFDDLFIVHQTEGRAFQCEMVTEEFDKLVNPPFAEC